MSASLKEKIGLAMFRVLTKSIEHGGFLWKEDQERPYFDVDMHFTPSVHWRAYITKNYWIFVPLDKMPYVKNVHYSFPFPLGIWFHRTVTWEDGSKTHYRAPRLFPFFVRPYDLARDYLEFKKRVMRSHKV